jgi:hypothetical protein
MASSVHAAPVHQVRCPLGDSAWDVRCSHHTILTNQPDRALRMLVEVLGGQIFHEGATCPHPRRPAGVKTVRAAAGPPPGESGQEHTAVYDEKLAGDKSGGVGRQVHGGGADL